MKTVQWLLEQLAECGYIRTSDISTIIEMVSPEVRLGSHITDRATDVELVKLKEIANKQTTQMASIRTQLMKAQTEVARYRKLAPSMLDRQFSDIKSGEGTLQRWSPPNKPENVRVYVNVKGLRKVHIVEVEEGEIGVRGRYGKPANQDECNGVRIVLTNVGLEGCNWADLMGYIDAKEAAGQKPMSDAAMIDVS